MRTRIAPTPSGYLHRGNAANALLTHWWAQSVGGSTFLRIDDVDAPRVRQEYVDDIHEVLHWLGIDITRSEDCSAGPHPVRERPLRIARARAALDRALALGLPAYACSCSRSMLNRVPVGGCPGGCRTASRAWESGQTALRVAVPVGSTVEVDGRAVDLAAAMGDFVVWRRDDVPAYQWLSLVEDSDLGITHILRGIDLLESTAAQLHLARYLDDRGFEEVHVRHHDLVIDVRGRKLSKSQLGSESGMPRTEATRGDIRSLARELGAGIGLPTQ